MANNYGDEWYSYLESRVLSKVKKNISYECTFTTEQMSVTNTSFPCVYLHELENPELGSTIDGQSVNGVLCSIQVDVFATTKSEAKQISRLVTEQMKAMRFRAVGLPYYAMDDTDVHHGVMRYRRVIGADDSL